MNNIVLNLNKVQQKLCMLKMVKEQRGLDREPRRLNIRTAHARINDGDTLKLIGHVKCTAFESHTDGSAKPLLINKKITIEGDGDSTSHTMRS